MTSIVMHFAGNGHDFRHGMSEFQVHNLMHHAHRMFDRNREERSVPRPVPLHEQMDESHPQRAINIASTRSAI